MVSIELRWKMLFQLDVSSTTITTWNKLLEDAGTTQGEWNTFLQGEHGKWMHYLILNYHFALGRHGTFERWVNNGR